MMEAAMWRAIHAYYFDDQDDLLLEAVRPLLSRLRGYVAKAYFVRHWRQGPHVRIPVLAAEPVFRDVVEPAVRELVEGYLARHPSATALPPEPKLLAMHERLAELEKEEGPLRPLAPDNSVRLVEHDRRLHTLDGEVGSDLLADFYSATNDLAFRMLDSVRAGRSRAALCLALMLGVAHSFFGDPPSIRTGFISFRSHAEAFLYASSDPDGIRRRFDRHYREQAPALTRLVDAVIATLDRDTGQVPFVAEWVAVMKPFRDRAEPLIRAGLLRLGRSKPGEPAEAPPTDSPMHQLMNQSEPFRRLFDDPAFQCYRLTLNYTYLHMARLGVMGLARYQLCHLAANAVEEALGLRALQMVEDLAQQAAG